MISRTLVIITPLLAIGGIVTGALYSWTIALGVVWFGASFIVLILVLKSFKMDVSSPPEEATHRRD